MIEAKLKNGGGEWEPISVERVSVLPDGRTERKYQYPELGQAHAAFWAFLDCEAGFPNVIARLATGGPRFTQVYDVRFVAVTTISNNLPSSEFSTRETETRRRVRLGVDRHSLLITLQDIKEELDAYSHGVNPEVLARITKIVDDVLEKAEGR